MEMLKCIRCDSDKAPDDFHWRRRGKNQRSSWCKSCVKIYTRGWHQSNRNRKRNLRKERMRNYADRVQEYLQSHPCVDCGESDPIVLDFDHVRGDKIDCITNMIRSFGWSNIEAEIGKCEVRCANCHRRKTLRERQAPELGYPTIFT